jgi:cytochrome c oxidase cbb3-type subunit 4
MDLNTLRSIVTVVSFIAFLAIVFWAYSPRKTRAFEEAAALPFREERGEASNTENGR